uniref:Core-2/I-branching beta-16-N-acetylglucosaminyltransferase family protein n=1 Tax=Oryza nivara TaxID=4536 RepID=A0A0E0G255_ORYNI
MKASQVWQRGSKDMTAMPPPRQRGAAKKPMWIIVLLSLVCVALIGAYAYPPRRYSACYFFASSVCTPFKDWLPTVTRRERTDEEIISSVVMRDLLAMPMPVSKNPKIALMFLTPGSLPFEKLWEKFLQGHEGRYSIYIHASRERPVHSSSLFVGREIHSEKVVWGRISMVDAEKRLLANALEDVDNQFFVLLSDSFLDPGPHGSGRYSVEMLPEIEQRDFRKGAQWFAVTRRHALLILADHLYYNKFELYCKPAEGRNCIADEHYLPTLFNMVDPGGISNWSVTHVDWSEGKWHPRSYRAIDVTYALLKNITAIKENFRITSDDKKVVTMTPCMWNGTKRPCYLFARKFYPEALNNLLKHSSYTST